MLFRFVESLYSVNRSGVSVYTESSIGNFKSTG